MSIILVMSKRALLTSQRCYPYTDLAYGLHIEMLQARSMCIAETCRQDMVFSTPPVFFSCVSSANLAHALKVVANLRANYSPESLFSGAAVQGRIIWTVWDARLPQKCEAQSRWVYESSQRGLWCFLRGRRWWVPYFYGPAWHLGGWIDHGDPRPCSTTPTPARLKID